MAWTVEIQGRLQRRIPQLPKAVRASLALLLSEIETRGPIRGNWANYAKLGANRHHCHLKKGHPTYVAVWDVVDTNIRIVEVIYVGTHEKAPY